MEAEIDKLSIEELKSIALKSKQLKLQHTYHNAKWIETHPDKKKESNHKSYEKRS